MLKVWMKSLTAAVLAAGLVVVVGCMKPVPATEAPKKDKEKDKPEHGEWWCDEHGVPEDECTMCDNNNGKAFKEAKAKGDICPKHTDRAKSQCFICNPELWEKSKVRYQEKYGKEAPAPKDNMPPKK
jgi:hypothetical protein